MFSKEALEAFKKQYKKEQGRELSYDEALAIALHENAILHTQNFVSRLEQEFGGLDYDTKAKLSEDIMSYSLSLILIYLGFKKKFDSLRSMVLSEYEKLIRTHSGAINEEQNKALYQFLYEKLCRNIMWLSTAFEKRIVIDKIISGISSYAPSYKYKSIVERLVSDVELSMKHFEIVPEGG